MFNPFTRACRRGGGAEGPGGDREMGDCFSFNWECAFDGDGGEWGLSSEGCVQIETS